MHFWNDYFSETPTYSEIFFRRRFRTNKPLLCILLIDSPTKFNTFGKGKMVLEGLVSLHSKNVQRLFVSWRIDAPRFVDPAQDDATMVETDVSPTKDKPGWIIDEHTDLKPAEVRVDELSDTTLELDELSDITLELSELNDIEDGAGLAAGRNEPFSAQRKAHKKFNMGLFLS